MIDDQSNPFLPTRWEHHGGGFPLIWFSETAKKITGNKPTFIAGTRGSGKTTLLKSICWEDLTDNPSLMAQISITDLEYVGIYIKFPEHISTSIGANDWKDVFPEIKRSDAEANAFFSLLVEVICIEKVLHAVSCLRRSEKLLMSAEDEIELCQKILLEYPNLKFFADMAPSSFDQLEGLMRNLVRRMNEASRRGNLVHLVNTLPSREPLELLRDVTTFLNRRCELVGSHRRFNPAFKFCLDDSEVLNHQQRMTINTMVRNSRHPITWVVCSVGDAVASSDTYLTNQKMAEADRNIIVLNQRDNKEFQSLCEVVANMRLLMARYPADSAFAKLQSDNFKELSLNQKFGETVINDMIHGMISRSKKKEAAYIAKGASILQAQLEKFSRSNNKSKKPSAKKSPPYAQAYLLMLWQGREESFLESLDGTQLSSLEEKANRLRDGAFNAWLRRKYVAALLHISDLLETRNLDYSGIDVLISMSDGSVRDFLEIMAEIYNSYAVSVKKSKRDVTVSQIVTAFQKSNKILPRSVQAKAFQESSKSFFAGAGLITTSEPGTMVNLIKLLGNYTSRLQANSKNSSALRYCERGIFTVDVSKDVGLFPDDEPVEELLELLWQAELSGYIRRVEHPKTGFKLASAAGGLIGPITFRLHKRLSAQFIFSYRGAYEGVKIDAHEIWDAINNTEKAREFLAKVNNDLPNETMSGIQLPLDFHQ